MIDEKKHETASESQIEIASAFSRNLQAGHQQKYDDDGATDVEMVRYCRGYHHSRKSADEFNDQV